MADDPMEEYAQLENNHILLQSVELHNHVMEGGIAKMRRVDAVALPAGKSIVLKQTQVPILSPLPASVRHTWSNAM
jgi:hypothetical protein